MIFCMHAHTHTHTQYLVLCQKIMHVPDFNDFFFSKTSFGPIGEERFELVIPAAYATLEVFQFSMMRARNKFECQ